MMLKLIKFGATWCQPCLKLNPVIEAYKLEYPEVEVQVVDVDEQPDLAKEFQVRSIPYLVWMKDGKVFRTQVGAMSLKDIHGIFLDEIKAEMIGKA